MIVLRLKRKNDVYVMPGTQSQRGAGLHAEHRASQFAAGRLGLLGGGRECDLKSSSPLLRDLVRMVSWAHCIAAKESSGGGGEGSS